MSAKTNNSKISIANVIAVAALAGLGVVTFLGAMLHSPGGSPGGPVIYAIGYIIALGALLFLGMYAKGVDNNPEKWRWVEWGCIALYIIIALLMAKPFLRYFYISSKKGELQEQANSEIRAIRTIYKNYNDQCENSLSLASEQIKSYMDSKNQDVDVALKEYVRDVVRDDLPAWRKKGVLVTKVKEEDKEFKELQELDSLIQKWNTIQLPAIAKRLEAKDADVINSLKKKIEDYGRDNKFIPVVKGSQTEPYKLDGYAKFDLGQSPKPIFAETLRNTDGNTVGGWFVYAILHLLVLFNLLVAPRSKDVNPNRKNKIGIGQRL